MLRHDTLREKQKAIEDIVMGKNFDANPIASLIADEMAYVFSKLQRIPAWVRNIQDMDLETVAFIGFLSVLDSISSEGGCGQAHGVISQMANRFKAHTEHDRRVRCGLAWQVLHCMRQAGLLRITTTKRGQETTVISMTRLLRDMITEHGLWGMMGLSRRPMIVRPVQHTIDYAGGYLTPELRKGVANGSWKNIKGQPIVDGLNTMQNTIWTVNTRVNSVATYLLEPFIEARDTNEYSHDACLRVAKEFEGMQLWNPTYCDTRGRDLYQADIASPQGNDLMRGLYCFHKKVDMDDEGLNWHFVHVANSLSGLPICDGLKLDKLLFEDRIKWVRDNIKHLINVAQNPISYRDEYWDGFGKGAKTFQALSVLDDLLLVVTEQKTRIPCMQDLNQNNYQWTAGMVFDNDLARKTNLLPLEDGQLPNDLHTEVGTALGELWESGEAEHEWMPVFLENKDVLTERGRVKPASMVIGYCGTRRGISIHMLGKKAWENVGSDDDPIWVRVAGQDSSLNGIDIPLEAHSDVAFAYAGDLEVSVYIVAPSAKTASNAVKECTKVANDLDQPLRWMSHSGILVESKPTKLEEFNLKSATFWDDQTSTQLKFKVFTDELNKRKALTSAPPNFTHSLDGSHLNISLGRFVRWWLSMMLEEGKILHKKTGEQPDVACVHDCYGTHAPYMGKFRGIIIVTFADIIDDEPLYKLCEAYGVTPPERGTLDTNEIRKALYALS
jgi:DNA-directed RNA polymerase